MAHRPLKGDGVGGVDLKREVGDALHRLHRSVEDGRLVQPGDADVDVEDVRSGVGLRDRLAEDVCDVALRQGGLQPLLPGGVDPLPYDDRAVKRYLDCPRA